MRKGRFGGRNYLEVENLGEVLNTSTKLETTLDVELIKLSLFSCLKEEKG